MKRLAVWLCTGCPLVLGVASGPATATSQTAAPLTAAQIVEKNVAARGGLEAWRRIQTMVWVGHIVTASAQASNLPFVLEMKRPNKTRFEIQTQNQMSARLYDGTHGWKLRPARDGMPELQAYSAEELRYARDGQGIDGPLMDYEAKGVTVALEGVDDIEGHKAYRLSVTLPSGVSHHVWIDAQSFLDVKYDRESRNAFGMAGTVSVSYHDYRTIEGLQIPFVMETGGSARRTTDRMVIDRISINPPLEDRIFARPSVPRQRTRVSIAATRPHATSAATPPAPSTFPALSGSRPGMLPASGNAH